MGNAFVIQIVIKYDTNIVCHLLLQVFFHLNLIRATIELVTIENDDLFFGQVVSSDDVIMSTLKNDLQLFQQLFVQLVKTKNPLCGGQIMQCNFPIFFSWFLKSLAL